MDVLLHSRKMKIPHREEWDSSGSEFQFMKCFDLITNILLMPPVHDRAACGLQLLMFNRWRIFSFVSLTIFFIIKFHSTNSDLTV